VNRARLRLTLDDGRIIAADIREGETLWVKSRDVTVVQAPAGYGHMAFMAAGWKRKVKALIQEQEDRAMDAWGDAFDAGL
jgi:hypothetical protein